MSAPLGAAASQIGAQIRRRREASYRCEALGDGRSDPLDKPRRGRSIQVRAIGKNTVEFVGIDHAIHSAVRFLGIRRYQRAPRGGAWLVHQDAADDVMALLESRGYQLEMRL